MAREIPLAVRAVAGLAATVLDEARKLPGELPGIPVRVLGLAMQTTLRLQQQFSGLVARGDEVFTGLLGDAEPGMATFDDDEDAPPPPAPPVRTGGLGSRTSAFDLAEEPPAEEDDADALAVDALTVDEAADEAAAEVAAVDEAATDEALDELADDVAEELGEVLDPTGEDPVGAAQATAELTEALEQALDEDTLLDEAARRRGRSLTDEVVEALPDDPIADAVIDAVEEVADEIGLEAPLDTRVVAAEAHLGGLPHEGHVPAPEGVLAPVAEASDAVSDAGEELGDVPDLSVVADASDAVDLADAGETLEADAGTDSLGTDPLTRGTPPSDDTAGAPDAGAPGPAGTGSDGAADEPEDVAAGTNSEPVEGYDQFSIASLRGHLRGYPVETVQALLSYEEATRGRAPYVTMLRNRLERLQATG